MNTSLLSLRKLKYKPLSYLIGRQIVIPSLGDVEAIVLAVAAETISGRFKLKNSVKNMSLVMAKYGFLDLEFVSAEQRLIQSDKVNSSVLRELGFIQDKQISREESQFFENDRACLEVLMEGIDEQACFLHIFMSRESSMDAMKRIFRAVRERQNGVVTEDEDVVASVISATADKIHQRLPATFTIEDACLANSDAIWLASHGYL